MTSPSDEHPSAEIKGTPLLVWAVLTTEDNRFYRPPSNKPKPGQGLLSSPVLARFLRSSLAPLPRSARAGSFHRPTSARSDSSRSPSTPASKPAKPGADRTSPGRSPSWPDVRDRIGRVLMQRPSLGQLRRVQRPRPTSLRPRARAACRPAWVRSRIRSRSNSAKAPKT